MESKEIKDIPTPQNNEAENAKAKDKKSFAKSTVSVLISNGLLLLSGLLSGFFIPKLLGVDNYAYLKTFSLYASYVTLFQFGLINGIFLKYGDKDFEQLDRGRFRLYSRVLFFVEAFVSGIIVIIGLFAFTGNDRVVVLLLAPYLFVVNGMTYFQQISQITRRFKEYSLILVLQSVLKVIAVLALWIVSALKIANLVSFTFYGILYVLIFAFIFVFYLIAYRDLIFGKADKFSDAKNDIVDIIKIGIPLLLADFVVVLVYECDRQVVSLGFDKTEFAFFSFAYTITGLITSLLSGISTVLYPTLKRLDSNEKVKLFPKSMIEMFVVGFGCCLSFFLLSFIIQKWLPDYVQAIKILKVILPGVVISAVINIIIQNYYKTENMNLLYFFFALGILALAIGSDVLCLFVFKNTESISAASVVVFAIWFFVSSHHLASKYKIKLIRIYLYVLVMCAVFYLVVYSPLSLTVGALLYLFFFVSLSFFFFFDEIIALLSKPKNMHHVFQLKEKGNKDISDSLPKIRNSLFRNKKILKAFFLAFLIGYVAVFSCGYFSFDGSDEAVSYALVKERAKTNSSFAYGEIVSSDYPLDTFLSVRPNTDKLFTYRGEFISKTFFRCNVTESFSPISFFSDDSNSKIDSQVITTTGGDISNNFGFSLYDGSELSDIDSTDFFISKSLADLLLKKMAKPAGVDYSFFSNYSINVKASKNQVSSNVVAMKIKGVISDESSSDFRKAFGDVFVFGQYNSILYYFGGASMNFFLYGSATATTTYLSIVSNICDSNDSVYSSVFYNHNDDGSFYIGDLQQTKETTSSFYKSHTPRYWFAGICYVCIIALVSFGLKNLKKIKLSENSATDCSVLSISIPLLSIIAFIFTIALFTVFNGLTINNFVYYPLEFKIIGVAFVLLFLSILIFCLFFSPPSDEKMIVKTGGKLTDDDKDEIMDLNL
jgi:O-antigen/teichoic acid export membrane protein